MIVEKGNNGLYVHGIWIDLKEDLRIAHLHISGTIKSLKCSSMNTQNNGTWERHVHTSGKERNLIACYMSEPGQCFSMLLTPPLNIDSARLPRRFGF